MSERGQLQRKTPKSEKATLYQGGHVLAECNLLDFPFSLLSNNNHKKLLREAVEKETSHITYEMTDVGGEKRVWRIDPSAVRGYTRPFDKMVLVTVLKLVTDDGFPPPLLWKLGSAKRVCRTMHISDKGKNVGRVKEALKRIASTAIYTESFFLKREKAYWQPEEKSRGGVFTLWSVFWKDEELPDGKAADAIYLHFNIPFILSLQDYYVKPLDYEYWLTLSPLQQRLYELTGRKFFGLKDSSYVKFDYLELCHALPIVPQRHLSKARTVLDPAQEGLQEDGWLQRLEWVGASERPVLNPKKPWELRFYPGIRAREELTQAKQRLRHFHKSRRRQQLPEWQDVQSWVIVLTELLQDTEKKNQGFYTKIGKLIVRGKLKSDLVWEAAHTAKTEDLAGNVKTSRSAFFTDYLKRQLKQRNRDLKQLLEEV